MPLDKTFKFQIGQKLLSRTVGRKLEFIGNVMFVDERNRFVHLKDTDGDGRRWHRDHDDLSTIQLTQPGE